MSFLRPGTRIEMRDADPRWSRYTPPHVGERARVSTNHTRAGEGYPATRCLETGKPAHLVAVGECDRGRLHVIPKRILSCLVLFGTSLLLTGCKSGVLDPQGPVGSAERTILFNALAIMLAIVVPTICAALWFVFWFREGNTKAQYRPQWAYSGRLELVVWSIPLLTITFLGGLTWIGSHELDPREPIGAAKPIEVQVVSLDWKWLFIYPDQGVASVNLVTVPAGTPVHFSLTSASVLNAFFVPQLGSMIYTMNGMVTQLNLQADNQGDFYGRSTMFSGDGFPGMEFTVHAVASASFDEWVRGVRETGPTLDRDSYSDLVKQSMNVKPFTYRSIDPHLFAAISTQVVPPAPGPQSGSPSPDASTRTGH